MRAIRTLSLVLACGLAGCAPRGDTSADEQAIQRLNQEFQTAVTAKDSNAVASLYANDATLLPPNLPIVEGRDLIRSFWGEFLQSPNLAVRIESKRMVLSTSGDMAIDVGTYHLTMDPPAGHVEDIGKYVTAFRKSAGGWKITIDTYNSDLPAVVPALDTTQAKR